MGARGGRWLVDPELQKWLATRSNGGSLGPLWGYGDGVGHSSSRWSARYPRGTGSSGWLEFAGDAGVRGELAVRSGRRESLTPRYSRKGETEA